MNDHTTPARRRGLVSGHISARAEAGTAVVCPGGVALKAHGLAPPPGVRGDRDVICGLSSAARRRMLAVLIRIPFREASGWALTLTWHDGFSLEPASWHRQLKAWTMRLRRDWGQFGPAGLWILEFQERGAPHFHLVVVWRREPSLEQFRRWLSRSWNAIAEPGDEKHRRAGTRADRIDAGSPRGTKRLLAYLVKHAGKSKQKRRIDLASGELLPTGKMWDVFGELPQECIALVELEADQLVGLYRRLRRWGRISPYLSQMGKRFPGGIIIGAGLDLAQLLRGLAAGDSSPP